MPELIAVVLGIFGLVVIAGGIVLLAFDQVKAYRERPIGKSTRDMFGSAAAVSAFGIGVITVGLVLLGAGAVSASQVSVQFGGNDGSSDCRCCP